MIRVLAILAIAALSDFRVASIDHDEVQPFAQPEPITDAEKAAVKFKPSLAINSGCHSYPAVDAAGATSGGLKGSGPVDGDCKGPSLGSQVYSRSTWYGDKWAIMYAWYFPKDMQNVGLFKKGVRHDWVNLVVNFSIDVRYLCDVINKPPNDTHIIDGTTPKVRYDEDEEGWHTIFQSNEEGEFQDLIQWNQLTDAAREALENTKFGEASVPFNDANFENNLKDASIDYDDIQPFAQPKPITDDEKTAVKFKPSLAVKSGCHPYPVVDASGNTSVGLKNVGPPDSECGGSALGSQVYGRSMWYEDKWAIMYAWYFPKDIQNVGLIKKGVRHDWVNIVVWLDNPARVKPKVLATSVSRYGTKYIITKPPSSVNIINDTTPMVAYDGDQEGWHTIFHFYKEGEYQDLIQWEQLTDAARDALENAEFGDHATVPFNDANFKTNLKAASTYYVFRDYRYGGPISHSIWE
ncbi:Necrosis inducing protein NPP1 [Phytophthora megakarya]|uniref:Necrosis inducing protein NPP1 n=1 Tax=Phytophthora megakarya TaxID=4795 RepID=A0A225UPQ5_9STRA|nr:Necrosis inducing protein NPP1 [Phytophthora megakarya]